MGRRRTPAHLSRAAASDAKSCPSAATTSNPNASSFASSGSSASTSSVLPIA